MTFIQTDQINVVKPGIIKTHLESNAFQRWYVALFCIMLLIALLLFYVSARLGQPFPLGNDNLRFSLPLRALLSSYLHQGIFAWWNPYSGGGVPLHTIYTSQGMSPIVLIMSAIRVYDSRQFIVELLLFSGIAFAGTYFLLRQFCSRFIAYLSAFTYTLNPFMLMQALLNIEAIGSASAFPWVFLGAYRILKSKSDGIPIFAGGLGLAYTSGYLGLNYFFSVFLVFAIFLCVIYLIIKQIRFRCATREIGHDHLDLATNLSKVIKYFVVSGVLCLGIMAPLIYETATNFDSNFFLGRTIDPYTVSTRLASLLTLFDVSGLSPIGADQYGGHFIFLYLPTIMFFGVLCAGRKPNALILMLFLAFAILFTASLSGQYGLTRLIISLVPGFGAIRLHSWLLPIMLLVLILIAGIGLQRVMREETIVAELVALYTAFSLFFGLVYFKQTVMTTRVPYFLGTLFTLGISLACLYAQKKVRSKSARHALIIIVVSLAICQIYLANQRWDHEGLNSIMPSPSEQIRLREFESRLDYRVTKLYNTRDDISSDDTLPYYLRRPVVLSYMPQRNPLMTKLIEDGLGDRLTHYILTPDDFKPIDVEITALTPNEIEFHLFGSEAERALLVTIPFSRNWIGFVNGERVNLVRGDFGFIKIDAKANASTLLIKYNQQPRNLMLSLALACWLTIVLWGVRVFWRRLHPVAGRSDAMALK